MKNHKATQKRIIETLETHLAAAHRGDYRGVIVIARVWPADASDDAGEGNMTIDGDLSTPFVVGLLNICLHRLTEHVSKLGEIPVDPPN